MSSGVVVAGLALGVLIGSSLQRSADAVWEVFWPTPRQACIGQAELAAELRGLKDAGFTSHLSSAIAVGVVVAAVLVGLWASEWILARAPRRRVVGAAATAAPPLSLTATPVASPSVTEHFTIGDDLDEIDLLNYRPVRVGAGGSTGAGY